MKEIKEKHYRIFIHNPQTGDRRDALYIDAYDRDFARQKIQKYLPDGFEIRRIEQAHFLGGIIKKGDL